LYPALSVRKERYVQRSFSIDDVATCTGSAIVERITKRHAEVKVTVASGFGMSCCFLVISVTRTYRISLVTQMHSEIFIAVVSWIVVMSALFSEIHGHVRTREQAETQAPYER
jgi:hypothetical protein